MHLKVIFIFTAWFTTCELLETHESPFSDDNLGKFSGDKCFRDCDNTRPRICYFKWHLEHYHVLGPACGNCGKINGSVEDCFKPQCITADGFERGVMSINRKIPGPAIHVCQNDFIVVDVVNEMGGTSSTIHWHGFHQRETPWMDGVPFITQCPINFANTFRYSFNATQAGTQFYHSHSGHHKVNGHYGGIVVRRPRIQDPNHETYDQDLRKHLIVVSDWMEHDGEMFMPGLRTHHIGIQPTNLLINGKGAIVDKMVRRPKKATPLEVFRVRSGQRYRFRFVNSMSHVCPVLLEIQNHSMLIIASDSYDLQPIMIDSLVSTSGERYDFVINANQLEGQYWVRLRALGPCEGRELEQFAILSYAPPVISSVILSIPLRRFPHFKDIFGQGIFLNHPNATCGPNDMKNFCITDLSSYVERFDITDVPPDYQFVLGFNNYQQNLHNVFGVNKYGHFMTLHDDIVLVGAINNISFTFPSFSLLTQPNDVHENVFCDENIKPERCNGMQICPCTHRLKVKLNSIVELIVVDETLSINNLNHPFHLHGYQMFVTGMGQHPDKKPMTVKLAQQMLLTKAFSYSLQSNHIIKDTISIPSKGYTVLRFKADNPGWWLLHCHYEWHMAVGMGLVLQVGETYEMLTPPDNFPKCNSYTPDIDSVALFNEN